MWRKWDVLELRTTNVAEAYHGKLRKCWAGTFPHLLRSYCSAYNTPSGLPENDVVLPIFSSRAIKESGQLMVTSHHPSLFSFGKAEEHPNPPLQAPLLCDPVEEIIIEEITLETNENGKGDTTT
ncbi:hypothetical protein RB195_024619 [Necator americanus]|uniref:Uncharacterized protein n=1 Tax=Necator americanus TaxID=51031 RepID=A0ABR1ENX4_NECAM